MDFVTVNFGKLSYLNFYLKIIILDFLLHKRII